MTFNDRVARLKSGPSQDLLAMARTEIHPDSRPNT